MGELEFETDARDVLTLPAAPLSIAFARETVDFVVDYTPGHGYAAFMVPRFDRYVLRRHADLAAG